MPIIIIIIIIAQKQIKTWFSAPSSDKGLTVKQSNTSKESWSNYFYASTYSCPSHIQISYF